MICPAAIRFKPRFHHTLSTQPRFLVESFTCFQSCLVSTNPGYKFSRYPYAPTNCHLAFFSTSLHFPSTTWSLAPLKPGDQYPKRYMSRKNLDTKTPWFIGCLDRRNLDIKGLSYQGPGLIDGPWNQGPQGGTLSSSSLLSMFIDQVAALSEWICLQPGFHRVNLPT